MRRLRRFAVALVALLALASGAAAGDPASVTNGGFEDGPAAGEPEGWDFDPGPNYVVRTTSDGPASGTRCAEISVTGPAKSRGFSTLLQSMSPGALRGRYFRLTSKLRVGGGGRAQMWLRVDRPGGAMGFFDNMDDRPVLAAAWTPAAIEGRIDADAEDVVFGAMLIGGGTAWVDDFRLEVGDAPLRSSDGPELLTSGGFEVAPEAWKSAGPSSEWTWDAKGGRGGGGALTVSRRATQPAVPVTYSTWLTLPSGDAPLRVSGWVRGEALDAAASIGAIAHMADGRTVVGCVSTRPSTPLQGTFGWTHVEAVLPASPRAARLEVYVLVEGRGSAWIDDVSVRTTQIDGAVRPERSRPERASPGLVMVRGEFALAVTGAGTEPRLLIPLPLSYREQVPLTFELLTSPADGLRDVRVFEDRAGNFVVDAALRTRDAQSEIRVSWRSLVLVGDRSFASVPRTAPIPGAWPDEAAPWLRSTWCAESDHPRLAAIGSSIRSRTNDALEVVRAVEERAAKVFEDSDGVVTNLTAVEALDKSGSCTSNANLVAAMLRASGVPARVLAGYPLWSGPLQTHYIVEAYVPSYGWYPIESTMCRSPWPPYQQVSVSIVPPEYEEEPLARGRASVCGGVPYLSLTELQTDGCRMSGAIEGADGCDHEAKMFRAYPVTGDEGGWDRALAAARVRWSAWLAAAKLDAGGRLATAAQPETVTATTASELADWLGR